MAVQKFRSGMVLRFGLAIALLLVLGSCGDDAKTVEATEQAEELMEPMTADEAKDLYIRHCESCHGMDGTKQVSGAADLSKSTKTDDQILQMILKGNDKGMMPYDELLTDREEKGLVEFVKTLQQTK